MKNKVKFISGLYLILVLLFIMGPILVTVAFSFNLDRFSSLSWKGFTLQWYQRMFANKEIMQSLMNSLILGVCVSLTSVLLGFTGAYGLRH